MPPPDIQASPVDNYVPSYAPDARWAIWSRDEIYEDGSPGQNKFVPKINDWVVEPVTGRVFRVTDLAEGTFFPDLTLIRFGSDGNGYDEVDMLLGPGVESFRAYYDKNTNPAKMAIDHKLYIYGADGTKARIYRGLSLDPSQVISRTYNINDEVTGFEIDLVRVVSNDHLSGETHDVYNVPEFQLPVVGDPDFPQGLDLEPGEIITVAIVNDDGVVLSQTGLIVEDTTFVSPEFVQQKYIIDIALETPFNSVSTPHQVNFPINIPLESFSAQGVLFYSDGSIEKYPINGTNRFSLIGINSVLPTLIGHRSYLTLKYELGPNDAATAPLDANGTSIMQGYSIVTSEPNLSYNVKLFVYPRWINEVSGYQLRFYLLNLDRDILMDVTEHVAIDSGAQGGPPASFQPKAYGTAQTLTFRVNLNDVSGVFRQFIHIQRVTITLMARANSALLTSAWSVQNPFNTGTAYGLYNGQGVFARKTSIGSNEINIAQDIDTLATWLNTVYRTTVPLSNPVTEQAAPNPTHFDIHYQPPGGGPAQTLTDIEVADYQDNIDMGHNIEPLTNIRVTFKRKVSNNDYFLSVVEMLVTNP